MNIGSDLARLFANDSAQLIFSFWDVMINLSFTTVLAFIIGYTYMKTHRGTTYSQYFVHALFIMALVTATIMMIIGSNIARAFTLVGALSIIRFRTAIKDTRDTGFIFFTIATGMACGTGFYLVGLVATIFICLIIFLLQGFDYGKKIVTEKIVKVEVPATQDREELFLDTFKKNLKYWSLINTERFVKEKLVELTFIVIFKKKVSEADFIEQLSGIVGVHKVQLLYNDQKVEI